MAWSSLSEALDRAEKEVVVGGSHAQSPLLQAEGLRYLARLFAAGALTELEASDPAYPQLVPFVSPWVTWGGTNPDCDYRYALLDSAFTYHLRGRRGGVHLLAVETYAGDFTDMTKIQAFGTCYDVIGGPGNIEVGADGEFDIVLSAAQQPGNWVPMPEGPGHLLVRSCYYDWDVADRAVVTITRDGATYPPPLPTPDTFEDRYDRFRRFLEGAPRVCAFAAEMYFTGEPGPVRFPPWSLAGSDDYENQISMRDQLYGQGHYECAPNQAVILEVVIPRSPYWSVNLSSPYLENTDWIIRQNSINGHQAAVDADGVFRAVLAHTDPGVPNWLDTGGHSVGIIQARFLLPAAQPEVTSTVVELAEVRRSLPADTVAVSPADRQAALQRRMLAVQRRSG